MLEIESGDYLVSNKFILNLKWNYSILEKETSHYLVTKMFIFYLKRNYSILENEIVFNQSFQ